MKIARLKFMVSLQSIIWVFLLNNFSRVINLLLTKLAQDRPGRISALGHYLQYRPHCARSVLSRPWADILPVRSLCLVNKIYIMTAISFPRYLSIPWLLSTVWMESYSTLEFDSVYSTNTSSSLSAVFPTRRNCTRQKNAVLITQPSISICAWMHIN